MPALLRIAWALSCSLPRLGMCLEKYRPASMFASIDEWLIRSRVGYDSMRSRSCECPCCEFEKLKLKFQVTATDLGRIKQDKNERLGFAPTNPSCSPTAFPQTKTVDHPGHPARYSGRASPPINVPFNFDVDSSSITSPCAEGLRHRLSKRYRRF